MKDTFIFLLFHQCHIDLPAAQVGGHDAHAHGIEHGDVGPARRAVEHQA